MDATRRRSAFTPLELIAVVATTAIVAALGYAAYRTYTVRGQVQEGLAAAGEVIPHVDEFFRRHGEVPSEVAAVRLRASVSADADAVVEAITIVDGRIDVLFGAGAHPSIAGRTISVTPYETADMHVVWVCGNEAPGLGLVPLGFAGGGRQASQVPTTVEDRYLSSDCR
jgi:Tfp pilus assembly protein PilE